MQFFPSKSNNWMKQDCMSINSTANARRNFKFQDSVAKHVNAVNNEICYTEDKVPIRKLYFSIHLRWVSKNKLENHFATFGRVEKFELHVKKNFIFGFVLYESVQSAANALNESNLSINKMKLNVAAADSWHQPTDLQSETVELDNQCSALNNKIIKITDLNDDCLDEILDYLDPLDLSAVARTCKRFYAVSQDMFAKNYSCIDFRNLMYRQKRNSTQTKSPDDDIRNLNKELSLYDTRNILSCFGEFISTLYIDANAFKKKNKGRILNLFVRHCHNLQSLTISEFYITGAAVRSLCNELNELVLNNCVVNEKIHYLFENCNNLTRLEIRSLSLFGSYLTVRFPKLTSFSVIRNIQWSSHQLYKFFELNPQLKSLEVLHCGYIYDEIFGKIGNHLSELESLSIHVDDFLNFTENLNNLLKLEKLRVLKLNCSLYSISAFVERLAERGTIEVLHITDGVLNEHLINALCECKSLRSLKLCSMPSVRDSFLQQLAENLPNLEDFHIVRCQTLTDAGLLKFVGVAPLLSSLHIINSTIVVTDDVYLGLVDICRKRGSKLMLNVSSTDFLTPSYHDANKQFVTVTGPICSSDDNESDIIIYEDSEYDDDFDVDDFYDSDDSFDTYSRYSGCERYLYE